MRHLLCFTDECEVLSDDINLPFVLGERFENLMGRLGLSDRKPVPDPVAFEDLDPLGSKAITNVLGQIDPLAAISK